jgi:integrase
MPKILREVLTRAAVERAKPRQAAYRLWDADTTGLCLRVLPSGIKTFEVHLKRGASERLGRHPAMTLDAARNGARRAQVRFQDTGERKAKAEAPATLDAFLRERYEPWVTSERKAGAATIAAIRSVWAELLPKQIGDITAWVVEKIKAARLKAGIKPATVNRDLVRIKAVISKAVEWNVLTVHPLSGVKRAKGGDDSRVRYLSMAEEKRLREALEKREMRLRVARASGNAWRSERGLERLIDWSKDDFADHLQPLVLLALNTGLRRGELFSLEWASIDMQRKMLTVRAGSAKSGRARHMPLNTEALDALKRWGRGHTHSGLVFPGIGGGRMTNINKSWASLMTAAKLEDFRFHDTRHDFASRLVMAGVDLYTVKELLGHSDFEMTQRYAHLAPEH